MKTGKLKGKRVPYPNIDREHKTHTVGMDLGSFRDNFDKTDIAGKSVMEKQMIKREQKEIHE